MPSPGDQLVRALDTVVSILDSSPQDTSGTIYVSSQQPLGALGQALSNHRRGRFVGLPELHLMFVRGGPLEMLSRNNGWLSDFEAAKALFDSAFGFLNCVRYFDSERRVELGDHVQLRVLFRKTVGRVNYVPGLSPPNPDIDFGGLFRIGIALPNRGFTYVHVDPDSLAVKEGVEFISSDSEPTDPVPSSEDLNE